MNIRTILLGILVVLTLVFASIAAIEYEANVAVATSTVTTIHTITLASTVLSQFPISFLNTPKGCTFQGYCVNSTLVNHLGSNISVIISAWIRNATTGQNVTLNGGRNSMAYATCIIEARRPSACLLVAYPNSGVTFKVTLTVIGLDGKTVLSPTTTAVVTY